jgi:phage-related minor tail protein
LNFSAQKQKMSAELQALEHEETRKLADYNQRANDVRNAEYRLRRECASVASNRRVYEQENKRDPIFKRYLDEALQLEAEARNELAAAEAAKVIIIQQEKQYFTSILFFLYRRKLILNYKRTAMFCATFVMPSKAKNSVIM